MDTNLFITNLIVGGLILLSFLKLSNVSKANQKANIYFGVFLFLWSTFWLDEILIPKHLEENIYVFIIIRCVQFLTPVAFYLSVIFYVNPSYKFKTTDILHIVLPLSLFTFLLFKNHIKISVFFILFTVIFLFNSLLYTVLAYYKINRHQKDIELFSSNKESIDLNWLKYIIYTFILSSLLIIFYNIFTNAESLNIYINLFFLTVVYLVAYFSIKQKEIYPTGFNISENNISQSVNKHINSSKNKLIDDSQLIFLKEKLLQIMQHQKPHLDSELNLIKLAELMQISGHQLSYVINTGFEENFFYFINKYRVIQAKTLLNNPQYDNLTIVAIGFDSGFNSKTAFNTTFKKITSYTPSAYRKMRSNL